MSSMAVPTDLLRRDILNGEFAPGDRLVELVLTERYKVGREAIRAALEELEAESLIERTGNRCAMVCDIDINEVVQISEVRTVIESLQAGHAAHHCDDEGRAVLKRIEVDMEQAVDAGDSDFYTALNREFHATVQKLSSHRVSKLVLETLACRSDNHPYRLTHQPGRMEASLREHHIIIDAICRNDVDVATASMTAHLRASLERLIAWHNDDAQ